MKLNSPKVVSWWIAVVLGLLAIVGTTNVVPVIAPFAIWFAIVGLAFLALATVVKGL
jgi:hypothetical protein